MDEDGEAADAGSRAGRDVDGDGRDGGSEQAGERPDDRQGGLPSAEEAFRLLVDGVRDYAIFMLDPSGRVATWNTAAERVKGWSAADVVGRNFSIFYPPEDVEAGRPARQLEIAVREGRFEEEGWRVRRDGSRFWANVVITALRDEEGAIRGFAKVTRDFSERRAAEETERRLAVETAARRSAQAAVAVRDDFLAIAGHELRTPLTALLFHVESLARNASRLSPDEVAMRARKATRNAHRLASLVDELLDVSRIVAGRLRLALEDVDLVALVHEIAAHAAEDAKRAGSGVRIEAVGPVVGRWDRSRVELVAANLLSNAIKYGRGAPIEISVERAPGAVRLRVRDHGMGIAPQDQARIFERFERAVSSRHFGGLGLGLWIVRQVVEAHGGHIRVVSAPGEGAEFTVELPLSPSADSHP